MYLGCLWSADIFVFVHFRTLHLSAAVLLCLGQNITAQHTSGFCTGKKCRNEYNSTSKIFYRSYWSIQEVPNDIPPEAVEVHLDGNAITFLAARAFSHLTQCWFLDLIYNKISSVDKNAFAGLQSLSTLRFSFNKMPSFFSNEVSTELKWLKILFFGQNKLSVIEPGSFDHLFHCVWFVLRANEITHLPVGLFVHMSKCQNLDLGYNQMSELEPGTFDGLQQLTGLHLEGNKLTILKPGIFRGLENLHNLHLDNNQIISIDQGAFDSLGSLGGLDSLVIADLTLPMRRGITLYNNNLTTLSQDLFINLPRPLFLVLRRETIYSISLWNCSSLCWLKHEEKHGTIKLRPLDTKQKAWDPSTPRCIEGVNWNSLQCGDPGELSRWN